MSSTSAVGLCGHAVRSWRIVIVLSALALLSVDVSAIEEFQKSNMVGRNPLHSFKLRWFRNERSVRKPPVPARSVRSPKMIKGSCLVRQHPDRRSVAAWFGLDRELDDALHHNRIKDSTKHCNHPLAGMTNPTVNIFGLSRQTPCAIPASLSTSSRTSQASGNDDSSPSLNRPWWPRVACDPPGRAWRRICFRRKVGEGRDCYQACRDAALTWEFDTGHKGIMAATPYRETHPSLSPQARHWRRRRLLESETTGVDENITIQSPPQPVQQIWWGPGRKLVTYTALGLPWLSLYAVSPVTVVYDVIDQRGAGTTYTSTAFATGPGHWLRGEERVTVCHRDVDDTVDVEILSYSQAASDTWMGRIAWPVLGRMQRSFFQQQLRSLQRVGQDASPEQTPSMQIQ
jgi:uncharacterized protein (UPF0548 family)